MDKDASKRDANYLTSSLDFSVQKKSKVDEGQMPYIFSDIDGVHNVWYKEIRKERRKGSPTMRSISIIQFDSNKSTTKERAKYS